jgi:hypothetical protein
MNRRELQEFHSAKVEEKFGNKGRPKRVSSTRTLPEPFEMPNEGEVWVYPISFGEDAWAFAEAGRFVMEKLKPHPSVRDQLIQSYVPIWWTIAACRDSEDEAQARPVYRAEDASRLMGDSVYRQKVLQVFQISVRLGSDDHSREGLDVFFEQILEPLEKCCSLPNNADYWTSSQEILTDLLLRLRVTRQRRTLLLATSEEVEPGEEAEPKPGSSFDGLELPPVGIGRGLRDDLG